MKVAAIQLGAGPDPDANLDAAFTAVRGAAAQGATLVVLPEKWLALGDAAVLRSVAERLDGALVVMLSELAAELGIDLIAGSISELGPTDDPRLFNTSLHLRPDGTVGAIYRKVHLFDADIAGRRYRESDAEQPGNQLVVTSLADPAFQAGLAICFDLRFAEFFRALGDDDTGRGGPNVITLPAAFTQRTTEDHWEVLVRARAIELGAFVIAANQCGTHEDGSTSGGRSLIVDPWGVVLARAGDTDPETIFAALDPAAAGRARDALPIRTLRRPEIYRARPAVRPPAPATAPRDDPARSD